ncbi:hypothetical protein [Daejeonella sp.]|uniref:hypothetical protein n=1 Tax=Daejeonella sp. TaxID=2805397 RepID=UPI0039838479
MTFFHCNLQKTGITALFLSCTLLAEAQQTSTAATRQVAPVKKPLSLRPDIIIEKVMDTVPLGVRLIRNPKTGEFWYSTFDGNVFRISDFDSPRAAEHKIFSAANHGTMKQQTIFT